MSWRSIKSKSVLPQLGSEGGAIQIDEEHEQGARITLERFGRTAPFAITCGIYGWMVHTRFFQKEEEAKSAVEEMKKDMDQILAGIPAQDELDFEQKWDRTIDVVRAFVEKHP